MRSLGDPRPRPALARALEGDRQMRCERGELRVLRSRLDTVTPREREVLVHVVSGMGNTQVARALGIAERTVELHRARAMEKLAADSLAELVRMAERLGLGPTGG